MYPSYNMSYSQHVHREDLLKAVKNAHFSKNYAKFREEFQKLKRQVEIP